MALGNSFLSDLLSTSPENDIQDESLLDSLVSLPSSDYPGRAAVRAIASINPYDEDYISGFDDFFQSAFDEAAAAGSTGPDAVRGGANRGEFFKADMMEKAALNKTRELSGLQQRQAEITTNAANVANTTESNLRAQAAGAQDQRMKQIFQGTSERLNAVEALARERMVSGELLSAISNLMAVKNMGSFEDLAGQGTQAGSSFNWGAGLNCCFIFAEALNGELPWYVRRGRDLMCTPQRKLGYVRMAARLVPAMRRYRAVMHLVNATMIKPFLACGKWYFTGKGRGWLARPVCEAWFKIWDMIGKA
jgi:hypothetical protein